MRHYCLLCGKKSKDVTYFKFPSDENLKKNWLQFCKVPEEDLKISHRLCSDHFSGDDLIWRAGRVCIKQTGTVPCKYKPENVAMLHPITSKDIQNNNQGQMEISSDTSPAEIITPSDLSSNDASAITTVLAVDQFNEPHDPLDVTAAKTIPPSAAQNCTVKKRALKFTDESVCIVLLLLM